MEDRERVKLEGPLYGAFGTGGTSAAPLRQSFLTPFSRVRKRGNNVIFT